MGPQVVKKPTRSRDNRCWTLLKLEEDILNLNLIATIPTRLNGNSNFLTDFSTEIMLEPTVFDVNYYLLLQNKCQKRRPVQSGGSRRLRHRQSPLHQ